MSFEIYPNPDIAAQVVSAMTHEKALSSIRLGPGDQYFVFAVKTTHSDYVIRMTEPSHERNFRSAIYWQKKLLPLGIPLAKFIKWDLEGNYSQFPALLMNRLPGDDLYNIYTNLTAVIKKNLAKEVVKIQAMTQALPIGNAFGIAYSYDQLLEDKSWHDFLMNKLQWFKDIIKQTAIFDPNYVSKTIAIANELKGEFNTVHPQPVLWDVSERNVIVENGKISGIVDVEDMCFGDPLFVLGLTHVALENEGYDTLYSDFWAEELKLDDYAKLRLEFYKLFYTIMFMRKHGTIALNYQKINFDVQRLENIFSQALLRIKKFG